LLRPTAVASRRCSFTLTLLLLLVVFSTAAGAATQPLTCSPTALRFGSIMIGQSETLPVVLTNTGYSTVTVNGVSSSLAAFSVDGLSMPFTLGPGKSVTFSVAFTPTGTGWQGESITFNSTVSLKSFCAGAAGTGVTNQYLTPSPASLSFGNVSVGSTSNLPMTLTNSGTYYIELTQEQTTGSGFSVSGLNLPMFLAPKQSVTFNVAFAPQLAGAVSGEVALTSTGLSIPLTATGTSTGQLSMTPSALSYGNVDIGQTGTQTVTMNATGASVTINSASSNNSQFALVGASFPVTIPAGQSASFNVGFTPKNSGSQSGTLTFTSTAPNSPEVESASGSGVQPTYSVGLTWNPSDSQNITGYNIYRAVYANACGAYAKINSAINSGTSYADASVSPGMTYCYATTAVNSSNQESSYSNQAQVAIP
jgi:hypothetical protein